MHLVGFIIRIYQDVPSPDRQILSYNYCCLWKETVNGRKLSNGWVRPLLSYAAAQQCRIKVYLEDVMSYVRVCMCGGGEIIAHYHTD